MPYNNKVLIVDDDILNLEILVEILEEFCSVKTAQNGKQALDIIPQFMPDLILLDIMMPDMNGYEVCKTIRADSRFSYIKIILVSGKAMIEERLEGYRAGADDYITKPFIDEELEAKVRIFLKLKRAEEVDQIKSDLLRVFSHETRTPLNGILLSTELLLDDDTLKPDTVDYIKVIEESGNRILDFVKKTSLLCDIKSGIRLNKYVAQPADEISQCIQNLKPKIDNKNIHIEFNDHQCDSINADWSLINILLTYIIDNAIKFSNQNGLITLSCKTENNGCMIHCQDQGIGIEPEWIDKIFNEFAIKDIMHHQKGLGLSLAIAKYILEMHQGSIKAMSEPGKGTEFIIYLPSKTN